MFSRAHACAAEERSYRANWIQPEKGWAIKLGPQNGSVPDWLPIEPRGQWTQIRGGAKDIRIRTYCCSVLLLLMKIVYTQHTHHTRVKYPTLCIEFNHSAISTFFCCTGMLWNSSALPIKTLYIRGAFRNQVFLLFLYLFFSMLSVNPSIKSID